MMSGRNEWERCIESSRRQLVESLIVNSSLLRELRVDCAGQTLLTQQDVKEIAQESTTGDKAETLLTKLCQKRPPVGTSRKFCSALQATGQRKLSQIVNESLKQDYERRRLLQSLVVNEPDSRSSSPTLQRAVPSDMIDAVTHVVGPRWRHLAYELGLSDYELESFDRVQVVRQDEGKARRVLQTWVNRRGSLATIAVLMETCSRIQIKDQVEDELRRKQKDPIARLGAFASEIFYQAMLNGRAPLCRALVHVVGSGESETTNLIFSLLKLPHEKDITKVESNVHVGICRGATMRAVTDDEHLDGAIARCFLKMRQKILRSRRHKRALLESCNKSLQDINDSDVKCLLSEGIDVRLLNDYCQLTNNIAAIVNELEDKKSVKSEQEEIEPEDHTTEAAINFIQHTTDDSFFAIHLALLDQPVDYLNSLYMLVFKLTQLLGIQSKSRNADNGHSTLALACRAIQLSSVQQDEEADDGMGRCEKVVYPPIAFVGIHTGEAEVESKIDDQDGMVKEIVEEASCHNNVIKPNKQVAGVHHLNDAICHEANMFFTTAGREVEDPVVIDLRKRIVAMIRTFWSDRVQEQPMRWHCYEKVLKALQEQLPKGRCSLSAARLLAKSLCCMDSSQEVDSALRYLRSFGSILYYPQWKELQDIVFINPQWLVNVATTFVTGKNVTCRQDLHHHWDLARLRGLLTVQFVHFLLSLCKVSIDDFSEMIQILGHFGFLFPFTSLGGDNKSVLQGYFAPFLITTEFRELPAFIHRYTSISTSSNFPPSLVFMADDEGLLFEPLFLRLIGRCLERFPKMPELKRNRCVFHTPHGVDLELFYADQRYVIATVFTINTSISQFELKRCCVDLRQFLQEQLELAKRRGMAALCLRLCLLDVSKLHNKSLPLSITKDCLVPLDKSQLLNSELWLQQQQQQQQQQQEVKSQSSTALPSGEFQSDSKPVITVADLPLSVSARLSNTLSTEEEEGGGWRRLADKLNIDFSTQRDIEHIYEDRCSGVVHCWEKREGRQLELKVMYESLRGINHRRSVAVLDEFLHTVWDRTRLAVATAGTKDGRMGKPLQLSDSSSPCCEARVDSSICFSGSDTEVYDPNLFGIFQSGIFTEVLDTASEMSDRVGAVEETLSTIKSQMSELNDRRHLEATENIFQIKRAIVNLEQQIGQVRRDTEIFQDLESSRHHKLEAQIEETQAYLASLLQNFSNSVVHRSELQQIREDMCRLRNALREQQSSRKTNNAVDGSQIVDVLQGLLAGKRSFDTHQPSKPQADTTISKEYEKLQLEPTVDKTLNNFDSGMIEVEKSRRELWNKEREIAGDVVAMSTSVPKPTPATCNEVEEQMKSTSVEVISDNIPSKHKQQFHSLNSNSQYHDEEHVSQHTYTIPNVVSQSGHGHYDQGHRKRKCCQIL